MNPARGGKVKQKHIGGAGLTSEHQHSMFNIHISYPHAACDLPITQFTIILTHNSNFSELVDHPSRVWRSPSPQLENVLHGSRMVPQNRCACLRRILRNQLLIGHWSCLPVDPPTRVCPLPILDQIALETDLPILPAALIDAYNRSDMLMIFR
ncbi:predicted protein [Histoplasma capsulatum G186AR]|uniref:Uncharacterized protein n=1 Tax=Ajellomyces capsulatus (strain G186AR / H82 / ATCC MYA-2454 / RMSCC 2432) TaxID=447093 RepID=C0NDU1_AJECG|nr:uncharacterized protein HCBG_02034 [Histoplasma capsulatum G186AR]EEH10389.1 predicted protein [Histoplasma capsulatum G186AR]